MIQYSSKPFLLWNFETKQTNNLPFYYENTVHTINAIFVVMHSCQIFSITSQDIVLGNAGSFIRFPKFKQQKKKLVPVYIFFFNTKLVWLLMQLPMQYFPRMLFFMLFVVILCVQTKKNVNINWSEAFLPGCFI